MQQVLLRRHAKPVLLMAQACTVAMLLQAPCQRKFRQPHFVSLQVLIDNLVYSPVFNLLVMVYIATVVEGMP